MVELSHFLLREKQTRQRFLSDLEPTKISFNALLYDNVNIIFTTHRERHHVHS